MCNDALPGQVMGCSAVWKNVSGVVEIQWQGCWSNPTDDDCDYRFCVTHITFDILIEQFSYVMMLHIIMSTYVFFLFSSSDCIDANVIAEDDIYFCCCQGDRCNQNPKYEPIEESSARAGKPIIAIRCEQKSLNCYAISFCQVEFVKNVRGMSNG